MERRWRMLGTAGNLVCLVALAACVGCGDGGTTNLDTTKDDGAINMLIVELADVSSSPVLAEKVFDKASMPKPADRAKYSKYNFRATEKQIEGTTAKMKVEVTDFNGAVVGTQDWTATKADGTWKLQSAPVP
jgi:hypothetical protein